MTSPDFPKGFLPTSTPISKERRGEESGYFSSTSTPIRESHEESGYFGSSRKNHWFHHSTFKELYSLSPVKELSPLHKDVARTEHEDSKNFSLSFSPPCKKYQSRDSVNFTEQAHVNTFDYSPPCAKYQSRNTSNFSEQVHVNKVNFIEELEMRNCGFIISQIFSNLSDKDLCNVSFVSQHWRNAVLNDPNASVRRKEFLKHRKEIATGPNKENRCRRELTFISPRKDALNNISNLLPSKVSEQALIADLNPKSRYGSFVEEAEKLNDNEILFKCPKCIFPGRSLRSDTRCICTRASCQYVFCNKCLSPYYNSARPKSTFHQCYNWKEERISEPKIIVCSKQSKKNLRRL